MKGQTKRHARRAIEALTIPESGRGRHLDRPPRPTTAGPGRRDVAPAEIARRRRQSKRARAARRKNRT